LASLPLRQEAAARLLLKRHALRAPADGASRTSMLFRLFIGLSMYAPALA
jgi:hypothetical protein